MFIGCIQYESHLGIWSVQLDGLLPVAKVSYNKFGERYCLTQNPYPRAQAFYSNKYDGARLNPYPLLADRPISGIWHSACMPTCQSGRPLSLQLGSLQEQSSGVAVT